MSTASANPAFAASKSPAYQADSPAEKLGSAATRPAISSRASSTSCTVTGSRLPLARTRPTSRNVNRPGSRSRSRTAPERSTAAPYGLVSLSSLDAVFTVSPMTVVSIRCTDPIVPSTTGPA